VRLLITGGSGFIGTNLVDAASSLGDDLVNLDITPPLNQAQAIWWRECDVMCLESLVRHFQEFRPTHVIHLAARTDTPAQASVEDYRINYEGTRNVIVAAGDVPEMRRALFTSTQFVIGPHHKPAHMHDYAPHTAYGSSKVLAENLIRDTDPQFVWTITRPTNIWGPWHFRYRREAWRVIERGLYLHPGRQRVTRAYGYVGNIIWQMQKLLVLDSETVHRNTVYLTDRPVDVFEWVNAFSAALRGRSVRRSPRAVLRLLAMVGDVTRWLPFEFPLNTSRYRSMTSDYLVPADDTISLLGEPPFPLSKGVEQTVSWLRSVADGLPEMPAAVFRPYNMFDARDHLQ